MKFYGTPNQLVNIRERKLGKLVTKPKFRFDENGEYETEDMDLIERLKPHFKHDNNAVNNEKTIECDKKFICKKCGFETENRGVFLAHCKKEHPKNKEE